ncbi:MAG: PQQ-dependent sugar dehydrogenase [Acidimicrobiales bacterium]
MVAGIALAVLVTSCGDDGGSASSATNRANTVPVATTTGAATTIPATTTPATTPPTTAPAGRNYDFTKPEVIATGLSVPWGIAFLPDGTALVAERMSGRIVQLRAGTAPQPVMTVADVSPNGEGGLLGLATSPTYAQDGLVYAYFTTTTDNRVARFRLGAPPQVILSGIAAAGVHNGGRLAFGPDGLLYVTTGDAAAGARAQDLANINGKILRIKADGSPADGNPFPGSPVWSLGHRNVQGLAWDARGRLFASEFGGNAFDEVNLIEPGKNYGWPTVEGTGNNPAFVNPLVTWSTNVASPSGAAISGDSLYVAALAGARLWKMTVTPTGLSTPQALLEGQFGRLRTVVTAPDGALWVATSNRDGRGTPTPDDDRIIRFAPTP